MITLSSGVRRTRSLHAATGVWLVVGLLFLSATGLTWSRWAGGSFTLALDKLNAHQPDLDPTDSGAAPAAGHHAEAPAASAGDPARVDAVLHIACGNGITGPMEIAPPADPGAAWTMTQTDNVWLVRLDRVAVDPVAGTVTGRSNFADWPLLAQLSKLGIQAHKGYLIGLVNLILLAALARGLLCVIIWGTACGGNDGPRAPTAAPSWDRHRPAAPGGGSSCRSVSSPGPTSSSPSAAAST
ncbi:PepSY domain-containing protein [Dactylosporangium sp. CA-092794]|uniref:PepSY domain-containing protein n=1 Tax=Dactylosporangium sp. CA-092794 TaxID=3239929 RepID=UPI003D8E59EC